MRTSTREPMPATTAARIEIFFLASTELNCHLTIELSGAHADV
jgi:hypothetical protein